MPDTLADVTGRRILVTGGAGFIGSNIVDACIARGDDVVVFDDLSTGNRDNLPADIDLRIGDIADADAVRAAAAGCEVIFHLAAHRSVFRSVESPLASDRANVGGTLAVLEAARANGARRVVSTSSSSVYGGAETMPTPETVTLQPRSPYAVSKMAAEHYCRVFWELFGLETVSLRYFNVYGPRQRPDSAYAAVIPLFIDAIRTGTRPEVHGDGLQTRDFTYVTDTVAANLLAADAPAELACGRAFNVAGGDSYSLMDLLAILGDLLGATADPIHVGSRPGDVRHTRADLTAVHEAIGYTPEVDFRQGLANTVDWFVNR
jgi:UDP-glucose 4-epimerase